MGHYTTLRQKFVWKMYLLSLRAAEFLLRSPSQVLFWRQKKMKSCLQNIFHLLFLQNFFEGRYLSWDQELENLVVFLSNCLQFVLSSSCSSFPSFFQFLFSKFIWWFQLFFSISITLIFLPYFPHEASLTSVLSPVLFIYFTQEYWSNVLVNNFS